MPSLFPQLLDFGQFAPLILRLVLGIIFVVHGFPKLFTMFSQTAMKFGQMGIRPAKFWVLVVGIVEFFGGILLIVGFWTQLAALLIAVNMAVAIILVKRRSGFVGGYELDLALLAMALALVFLGAGFYAFDKPF